MHLPHHHLKYCVGEKKFELAHILLVRCTYLECGLMNDVPTGNRQKASNCASAWDVNTKLAAENLALHKPTHQDHPYHSDRWGAEKAVDGKYDNLTSDPSPYVSRLAGFFLYVSNTSSTADGHLCFHEIQNVSGTPSENQTISCPIHGQYVIFYNERRTDAKYPKYYSSYSFNELCELQVVIVRVSTETIVLYPAQIIVRITNVTYTWGNVLGVYRDTRELAVINYVMKEDMVHSVLCPVVTVEKESLVTTLVVLVYTAVVKDFTALHVWMNVKRDIMEKIARRGAVKTVSITRSVIDSMENVLEVVNQDGNGLIVIESFYIQFEDKPGFSVLPVIGGILAPAIAISITIGIFIFTQRLCSEGKQNMKLNSNLPTNKGKIVENVKDQKHERDDNTDVQIHVSPTKHNKITTHDDTDEDIDDEGKLHDDNPYGDMYYNEETLPDISLDKLEETIAGKCIDDNDGFKREYAALPYGKKYTCDAGNLPGNITKNRYQTSLPYDHTRVKLKNNESDYINASFINGLQEENAYIAAQGPKQNTVSDFWALIWQERVKQIVMLTNLREGNKAKCFQYWADVGKSVITGGFSIHTVDEKYYAFYVIRTLKVIHRKLKQKNLVQHYQFTAWLDHGIPEPFCLVVFHDHVRRTRNSKDRNPTLVHCSAGIGRTGTYISIDALYKVGVKERTINIAEFVKRMRENRMNMVQTYEQYMTIYLALEHVFKASPAIMKKSEFLTKTQAKRKNKPENQSDLREEFQTLLKVRPSYTESDYKMSRQSSRGDVTVLPLDKYSLFLPSSIPKRGNYINAVSLPSYTHENKFIVTHYPTPDDAVDFLRLLIDHESETVISMEPLSDVKSSEAWLPDSAGSKWVSPFTVLYQKEDLTSVKCTTIHIIKKGQENYHAVEVIEPTFSIQSKGQCAKQLLEMVSSILGNGKEGPVTVISSDGAALCGMLCAVYNVVQQLSMDDEIDIFTAVRQLQIRRPELCSTWTEYKIIYTAVMEYIQTQEEEIGGAIYSNQ
ncbi:receptor-type tyrosine-protein phosphatase epsilon-like [Saccostrea echinata]|uniref:receptor-type tyrosine-protein phosphatase epsilon-like n=1 Tax=Saccostrea echinata TaxID=191078 RepID=UPI002A80EDE7|nr:receptor-type tyrosine-protein phosphatase epsilon-like [Saccostrea echinata]